MRRYRKKCQAWPASPKIELTDYTRFCGLNCINVQSGQPNVIINPVRPVECAFQIWCDVPGWARVFVQSE